MSRKRELLITIDGDGFIFRDRVGDRAVGELILEEVLTQYPFKFTASFIAGEMGTYRDSFDLDLAARILALENVEAASHSWSHPHDWASAGVDAELRFDDVLSNVVAEARSPRTDIVLSVRVSGVITPKCLGVPIADNLRGEGLHEL